MPLSIREATDGDRPALEAMMAALQDYERTLHPHSRRAGHAMASSHLDFLLGEVAARLGCCLLAEAEGEAIGFLLAYVDQLEGHYLTPDFVAPGHVSDLFVAEAWRGRGVADALLDAAEAHLRALGVRQLTITYLADNFAAERAYEKRGFVPYMKEMVKRLG